MADLRWLTGATFGRAYTALTTFLAAHGRSAIGRLVTDVALTARHLVGREDELAAIVELLDAPEQLPGLPGEAGIGKTTLWLAGIDAAAARSYRSSFFALEYLVMMGPRCAISH